MLVVGRVVMPDDEESQQILDTVTEEIAAWLQFDGALAYLQSTPEQRKAALERARG